MMTRFLLLWWLAVALMMASAHHLRRQQEQEKDIILGVSIYGLETELRNTVCSWVAPAADYIHNLALLGFNSIRIPLSMQYIKEDNFSVLVKMIEAAQEHNMSVVLDIHRIGTTAQEFSPCAMDLTDYINQYNHMLTHVVGYPNVKYLNAWNEFQGVDFIQLSSYTSAIFTALEQQYPGRFVFFSTGVRWGGVIKELDFSYLRFSDRIFYSIHKYIFSGASNLDDWTKSVGNHTNFVVGEWGFKYPQEQEWAKSFLPFLFEYSQGWYFWTIAHSIDTDGLWKDDCVTFDYDKWAVIAPLMDKSKYKLNGLGRG